MNAARRHIGPRFPKPVPMGVLVCWVVRLGYIYSNARLLQGSKTVLCLHVACTVRILVRNKQKLKPYFCSYLVTMYCCWVAPRFCRCPLHLFCFGWHIFTLTLWPANICFICLKKMWVKLHGLFTDICNIVKWKEPSLIADLLIVCSTQLCLFYVD